jgi:hypothetical protein
VFGGGLNERIRDEASFRNLSALQGARRLGRRGYMGRRGLAVTQHAGRKVYGGRFAETLVFLAG